MEFIDDSEGEGSDVYTDSEEEENRIKESEPLARKKWDAAQVRICCFCHFNRYNIITVKYVVINENAYIRLV